MMDNNWAADPSAMYVGQWRRSEPPLCLKRSFHTRFSRSDVVHVVTDKTYEVETAHAIETGG